MEHLLVSRFRFTHCRLLVKSRLVESQESLATSGKMATKTHGGDSTMRLLLLLIVISEAGNRKDQRSARRS